MLKKVKESIDLETITSEKNPTVKSKEPKKSGSITKDKTSNGSKLNFPVVGIGASAGGLAAFEAFFSGMPAESDTGMAFILVQHLAPDHKSILTELVKRYTRMNVFEVTDGMTVEPDCAYIIPPNYDMAFLGGSLQLLEPGFSRGCRLPIDFFFRSLAQDLQDRAICIVLSGTGSDGTLGIRAIKGEGGMAMAQNPESTEFDGMPRSAIATGLVDYILPPAEMPSRIIAYCSHAYRKILKNSSLLVPKEDNLLKKIYVLLRNQVGHDFSQYKKSTVQRRLERRLAVNQIKGLENYVRYLQQNPQEIEELFHDLLIGVTNFFRDPKAFEALAAKVIPQLFINRDSNSVIRIWVAGCSTGEEAYSIAILIKEYMETIKQSFKVQIFATDIFSRVVETARAGIYPANIVLDVSQQRLARFFTQDESRNYYRIHKDIRDMMIFSEQNVIQDPPFSKLDLISCRNLLIYMEGSLQKKIMPLFHYSLNREGFLFLGSSESIGDFVDLFSAVDRSAKLYIRKDSINTHYQNIGSLIAVGPEGRDHRQVWKQTPDNSVLPLREIMERSLLEQYGPISALVNEKGEILYLHGRTGMFLEPSPGEFEKSILKMAREGLQRELTMSLHKAAATKAPVYSNGLSVKTNGDFTTINLSVSPVDAGVGLSARANLFLVIFEIVEKTDKKNPEKIGNINFVEDTQSKDTDALILSLTEKLRATEEYLQSSNEEMETTNEELKSSNEEMQSVNEELQSTNEELETSKEELQSVNEELSTVNTELQNKVADLSTANNDMNNLLAGSGIGTIFLDHQLIIKRFTPAITKVINLIPTDIGRPLSHLVSNLTDYNRLIEDVQSVLDTLIPREVDVKTKDGLFYSLRILPYRTIDNVIEGAVITFINISEIKKIQKIALEIEENYKGLFLNSPFAAAILEVVLDKRGLPVDYIFIDINFAFNEHTGLLIDDVRGKRISNVFPDFDITNIIRTYGKVTMDGKAASFKACSVKFQKNFNVCAYKISSSKFAAIFDSTDKHINPEKSGILPEPGGIPPK